MSVFALVAFLMRLAGHASSARHSNPVPRESVLVESVPLEFQP